jgi:protein-tyrosine phosphatase
VTSYLPQHLDWPDCLNARDLGGMPAGDGKRIRDGALIRSDRHSRLTEVGVATVNSLGIAAIVDLRAASECAAEPSPFARAEHYLNVDWTDTIPGLSATGSLGELYSARLDQHGDKIARAIRFIADAPAGGTAVHCAVGKDRTGIVIALLLDLVGVDRHVIAADYAHSYGRMATAFDTELDAIPDEARRRRSREMQGSEPESMLALLDHLERRHENAEKYLLANGLTQHQLSALTQRLVVD